LCIDWRGKNAEQASTAKIFARLAGIKTGDGPIVLLACEISLVRPLPQYCYVPFDLKNRAHRNFLDVLTKTGEIKLGFVSGRRLIRRTHRLNSALLSRSAEIYAEMLQELKTYGIDKYEFERALQLFERWVRIPELVERLLTEDDLPELSSRINDAVQAMPREDRDFAKRIAGEGADAFGPYLERGSKASSDFPQMIRRGLIYSDDLRLLGEDALRLKEILGDALAASFSRSELEALDEWRKFIFSIFSMFPGSGLQSEPAAATIVPSPPAGLIDVLEGIIPHRRISLTSLKKLATLLGLEVKGMPGRPSEDYSREYELRVSGLSWSQLARQMIVESPELHAECAGLDYDSLERGRQEVIVNRIRQGVTAYAKRVGKPLPAQSDTSEAAPPERV